MPTEVPYRPPPSLFQFLVTLSNVAKSAFKKLLVALRKQKDLQERQQTSTETALRHS